MSDIGSYIDTLPSETIDAITQVQQDTPVAIEELARMMRVAILTSNQVEGDGYLLYEDGQFTIYIHSGQSDTRQRFTIAHELAHLMLHKEYVIENKSIDRGIRSGYEDERERQADELAAEILMPFDTINNLVDRGVDTISGIADQLQVSKEDLRMRLGF